MQEVLTHRQANLALRYGVITAMMVLAGFVVLGNVVGSIKSSRSRAIWNHETAGTITQLDPWVGHSSPEQRHAVVTYQTASESSEQADITLEANEVGPEWSLGSRIDRIWYSDDGRVYIPADIGHNDDPFAYTSNWVAGMVLIGFAAAIFLGAIAVVIASIVFEIRNSIRKRTAVV